MCITTLVTDFIVSNCYYVNVKPTTINNVTIKQMFRSIKHLYGKMHIIIYLIFNKLIIHFNFHNIMFAFKNIFDTFVYNILMLLKFYFTFVLKNFVLNFCSKY